MSYSKEIKKQAIKFVYRKEQYNSSMEDVGNSVKYMYALDKEKC